MAMNAGCCATTSINACTLSSVCILRRFHEGIHAVQLDAALHADRLLLGRVRFMRRKTKIICATIFGHSHGSAYVSISMNTGSTLAHSSVQGGSPGTLRDTRFCHMHLSTRETAEVSRVRHHPSRGPDAIARSGQGPLAHGPLEQIWEH